MFNDSPKSFQNVSNCFKSAGLLNEKPWLRAIDVYEQKRRLSQDSEAAIHFPSHWPEARQHILQHRRILRAIHGDRESPTVFQYKCKVCQRSLERSSLQLLHVGEK